MPIDCRVEEEEHSHIRKPKRRLEEDAQTTLQQESWIAVHTKGCVRDVSVCKREKRRSHLLRLHPNRHVVVEPLEGEQVFSACLRFRYP